MEETDESSVLFPVVNSHVCCVVRLLFPDNVSKCKTIESHFTIASTV